MVYGMGYSLLRSRFTLFNSNNGINMQDTIHGLAMNAYIYITPSTRSLQLTSLQGKCTFTLMFEI